MLAVDVVVAGEACSRRHPRGRVPVTSASTAPYRPWPRRDISSSTIQTRRVQRGGEGVQAKSWQSRVESWQRHGGRGLARARAQKTWYFHVYHGTRGYFHSGAMQECQNPILLVKRGPPPRPKRRREKIEEKKGSRRLRWKDSRGNQPKSGSGNDTPMMSCQSAV